MRFLRWLTEISAFRVALWIGAVTAAAHLFAGSGREFPLLTRLDHILYDAKFALRGPLGLDEASKRQKKVVIAAGDERTMDVFGRWPWDRRIYAKLIDHALADGALAVAFDMGFADADRSLQELATVRDRYKEMGVDRLGGPAAEFAMFLSLAADAESPDQVLAGAFERAGPRAVLGYIAYRTTDAEKPKEELVKAGYELLKKDALSPPAYEIIETKLESGRLLRGPKVDPAAGPGALRPIVPDPPVQVIGAKAERLGFFNVEPDTDGVIRRVPLAWWLDGQVVPSLDLAAIAAATGTRSNDIVPVSFLESEPQLEKILLNTQGGKGDVVSIPVQPDGTMLVDFHGPDGAFQYVSLVDLFEKTFPPGTFKDRVVLAGVTAIATHDHRVTPFDDFTPGVEIHAAAIENVLSGKLLFRPWWATIIEFALLLGIAYGLGSMFSRVDARISIAAYVLAAAGYFAFDYALFRGGFVLTSAIPQLQLLLTFIGTTSYRYFTETKEKERVRNTFKFYLDAAVMEQMLKQPDKLTLGGDKKELSVLFSDIRGFTTISERLPPEKLSEMLNQYLTPMTNLVFQNGGTLDKYMGDAVMCFFGAPIEQPDHALRACRTALDMMAGLATLREKWRAEGLPDIDIGIGVNTGNMVVGNFGSAQRGAYTVMGDNVNLASRLEGTNKEYGTNVIISEFTHAKVQGQVAVRELGAVRVKGKRLPVKIYELLAVGPMPAEHAPFVKAFTEGLELRYPGRRFAEAAERFREALALRPGDLTSERYLEECEKLAHEAPADGWDGVYEMKTK